MASEPQLDDSIRTTTFTPNHQTKKLLHFEIHHLEHKFSFSFTDPQQPTPSPHPNPKTPLLKHLKKPQNPLPIPKLS